MSPGNPLRRALRAAVRFALLPLLMGSCAGGPIVLPEEGLAAGPNTPDWSWARLGPNDVVRVTVYGHPEATTSAEGERVDPTGHMTLPMIGTVKVDGLTAEGARQQLAERYSVYIREPKVAVTVLDHGLREFYLLGQVERPGPFPLDRPLTALQALSHGGSLLRGADRENVLLIRRREDRYDVHVFDVAQPDASGMVGVEPDDLIFVAQSNSGRFYEDVLPYLQGAGFLASLPVGFTAFN